MRADEVAGNCCQALLLGVTGRDEQTLPATSSTPVSNPHLLNEIAPMTIEQYLSVLVHYVGDDVASSTRRSSTLNPTP